MTELDRQVADLNQQLKQNGLLEIAIVSPKECFGQKVNARYFSAEKMQQLTKNIAETGALESAPLVYFEDGKWRIISGHHRVEAAKAAGIEKMLAFVASPESADEIVSKQLSHNALVGQDDKALLAQLFTSIQDVSLRLATGLNDEVAKISYTSLNFRIGEFKEFMLLFLPQDLEDINKNLEQIASMTTFTPKTEVHLAPLEIFDEFARILRRIKKNENIKSNAAALVKMVELAGEAYAARQKAE